VSASGRRPVFRWAWRLFKREWRQQVLVMSLLTFAVAIAMYFPIFGYNSVEDGQGQLGNARARIEMRVQSQPQLDQDVAALRDSYGTIEVIGHSTVQVPGSADDLDVRAQDPGGRFGAPMLALLAGRYPSAANEVALTEGAAEVLKVTVGQQVSIGDKQSAVVGLVENPGDLNDEFALVDPDTAATPNGVALLVDADVRGGGMLRSGSAYGVLNRGPDTSNALVAATLLLIATVVLLLVALVAAAGFAAVAQRRQRQLGMLAATGASDRHLRFVMLTNGVFVGVISAVAGVAVALGAWRATANRLETVVGHRIGAFDVPVWLVLAGPSLAVATATAAAWWPARAVTRVPITEALSGRPPTPSPVHRSVTASLVLLVGGCLALTAGVNTARGYANPWLLIPGVIAVTFGVLILSPLAIRGLARFAARAPISIRLALRDLNRHQARTGAALAAISLGLGIAVTSVVVAAAAQDRASEGNLSAHQMLIRSRNPVMTDGEQAVARTGVDDLVATLGDAKSYDLSVATLEIADAMSKAVGDRPNPTVFLLRQINGRSYSDAGIAYVATPELMERVGLDPELLNDDIDVFTTSADSLFLPAAARRPFAAKLMRYKTAEYSSAPLNLITPAALQRFGFGTAPVEWLIESTHAFTADQRTAARDMAAASQLVVEARDSQSGLLATRTIATAGGAFVALCLLAMTIGLIRSEAGRDLQTLTAAGATSGTRRSLTAATSGALALLGSTLGIAGAYAGLVAIYSDRLTDLSGVPVVELSALLFGLPLVATVTGWLLAGREPAVITRAAFD
jgi:putative ABC transport system permease protein